MYITLFVYLFSLSRNQIKKVPYFYYFHVAKHLKRDISSFFLPVTHTHTHIDWSLLKSSTTANCLHLDGIELREIILLFSPYHQDPCLKGNASHAK